VQTIFKLNLLCQKDKINHWQHVRVWTTLLFNKTQQEQLKNATYWLPFVRCYTCCLILLTAWTSETVKEKQHQISHCGFAKIHWTSYCRYDLWKSVVNLFKITWIRFNNVTNNEGNGIVCAKLVWPTRACKVSFWPAARERLPTPGLAFFELCSSERLCSAGFFKVFRRTI